MAVSRWKQSQIVQSELLSPHEVEQHRIEAFEPDRLVFQHKRHMVRRAKWIRKTETHQPPMGRAIRQMKICTKHGYTRALSAHQRSRNMKTALRQQLIEVISGDTSRYAGKTLPHEICILIAQSQQARVDLTPPATSADDRPQFLVAGRAHSQLRPVIKQHIERLDVIDRLPPKQRMDSTGVVADHAANRAAAVGRGVGREGQLMQL